VADSYLRFWIRTNKTMMEDHPWNNTDMSGLGEED